MLLLLAALVQLAIVGTTTGNEASPPVFRLHAVFSDSMVLQAEAPAVYGTGTPGTKVVVSAESERVTATVAPDGRWVAHLKPRPASLATGPGIQILVKGAAEGDSCTLTDVLFGE
ncbi:hypothetical protein OAN61_00830 [bacterium]|nr:hypothetical protein [bacterium]